ncbi:MAG: hypothetical protein HC933_16400 [Pleurocapsa sp. SU_196_0]|nr:hypothetical protein [Pleurocapsa sp. SU_196_0]
MTRALSFVLALAFLGALTSSAQSNYYPSKVGLKWTYSSGETQQYVREDTVFNTRVLVMQRILDGKVIREEYLQSSADGVVLMGLKANNQYFRYQPPITVYPKAPLKVGATWTATSGEGAGKFTITSSVTATAGAKSKAGRFNAFIINSVVTTADGATSSNDLYFVPSIGTVRYVYQDGSTIDLVSR